MLFKSYPHTNHKAIKFVKLRVSMWIIRRKNFFNFSLLPVARLNCYGFFFFLLLFSPYCCNAIRKTAMPQLLLWHGCLALHLNAFVVLRILLQGRPISLNHTDRRPVGLPWSRNFTLFSVLRIRSLCMTGLFFLFQLVFQGL